MKIQLDGDYGSCNATYLNTDKGVCKSIWKCPTAFEDKPNSQTPRPDISAACSIQDKYTETLKVIILFVSNFLIVFII